MDSEEGEQKEEGQRRESAQETERAYLRPYAGGQDN